MKEILSAPVRLWQLILVSVLVAALTSTVVVSAAPFSPDFLDQGKFRMAVEAGTDSDAVNVPAGYTDVVVLQKDITVPPGKVADLAVLGEVDIEGGLTGYQYCFGQYRLDDVASGPQFEPGSYILEGFNPPPNNLSVPINGFLTDVPTGSHTVYMVMSAGYNDCYALNRSMIILANIH